MLVSDLLRMTEDNRYRKVSLEEFYKLSLLLPLPYDPLAYYSENQVVYFNKQFLRCKRNVKPGDSPTLQPSYYEQALQLPDPAGEVDLSEYYTMVEVDDLLAAGLSGKVNVDGSKVLSELSFTTSLKTAYDGAVTAQHSHANKSILDTILQAVVDNWNAAYTHISDAVKHITGPERTAWNAKMESVTALNGSIVIDNTDPKNPKLSVPGGSLSDAALSTKGVTKLSVAPASPTDPIAAGTNDPRLSATTGSQEGLFSVANKTKLDGIATSANNYTHPNHTGDVTSTGDGVTAIASGVVTDAKLASDVKIGSLAALTTTIKTSIQAAINELVSSIATLTGTVNGKAPLASPTFSGTPSLPTGTTGVTQSTADNTTKLATTAFVQANIAALPPSGDSITASANQIIYRDSAGNYVGDTGLQYNGTKTTFTGADSSYASINVPEGSDPASPVNGDLWHTSDGWNTRIAGTSHILATQAHVKSNFDGRQLSFKERVNACSQYFTHFELDGGMRFAGGGTGSQVSNVSWRNDHYFAVALETGITSTGRFGAFMRKGDLGGRQVVFGAGAITCSARVWVPTLSNGTERFAVLMGCTNTDSSKNSTGVYALYDESVSANWLLRCKDSTTNTVDSGVAVVANTWVMVEVVVNAAASLATLYINGISAAVCSTATSLPTSASVVQPQINIIKLLGTTSRSVEVDAFGFNMVPTYLPLVA